ncbi:MAG TPA: 7TM diverse intracellular signaling domain-containing protein [Flavobacteriales bacterium]
MSVRSFGPSVLLALASAVVQAGDQIPFVYQGEASTNYLGTHMQVLEDPTGTLGLRDAMYAPGYRAGTEEIPSPGITRSAYWVRLEVRNNSDLDELILDLPYPEIDEIDLYLEQSGAVVPIAHAGLSRRLDRSMQRFPEFGFRLPLGARTKATIHLRLKSFKPLRIPVMLQTPEYFHSAQSDKNVVMGGFAGIMIVMAIYNLFVFFSIRERSYLIYCAYIIVMCLTQLGFMGITAFYLWPENTWLTSRSALFLTAITAIIASEFMASFIHTRQLLPKHMRLLPVFYGLMVVGVLLDLTGSPLAGYRVIQADAAVFAFFLLYCCYVIARQGSRAARYFLAAWSLFLTGVITFVLKDLDLLPYNNLTRYAMPMGSVAEVVLLSFGLADKINVLRREKERSHAEALRMSQENERIIRDQNVDLERKVNERTKALVESNDHLKRTQSQLVAAEKMASLGQLTAGIAHEINNPLNFISSNIPPLKRDLLELEEVLAAYRHAGSDPTALAKVLDLEQRIGVDENVREVHEILLSMEEGASRTSAIVRGLRTFSRLDEDDLKAADLNEGLRSTLIVLAPNLRDQVEVRMDLKEIPDVECYPGKVNQVFMNILTNAAQAAKKKHGSTGAQVCLSTDATPDEVIVTIADNGVGMTPEVQARIFEPFFTTKDVGEGTGLGLSIVHSIIEKHGGRIEVDSAPGEGTAFRVILPLNRSNTAKRA